MAGVILADATLSFSALAFRRQLPVGEPCSTTHGSICLILPTSSSSPRPLWREQFLASTSSAMRCATSLTLVHASKSGYDGAMFALHKGDCEHCTRAYRYTLLHAGFGDFSYAYCDTCGMLATFNYSNSFLVNLPPASVPHQVIDPEWEPFINPCECGGHFRADASPRCVFCSSVLSAEHAATHIERNTIGAGRGWHWQGNWTDLYCIAMEDPRDPGSLRQVEDHFLETRSRPGKPRKGIWSQVFSFSR